MSATARLRFAPSPTGSLHLGNARTALFNWIVAHQSGGRAILRIEDTDTEREQAGSEAGILEDLRWLGLDWDEGPDVGGAYGPYRQSERHALYAAAAERLLEQRRAYRCFCTDEQLEAERAEQVSRGARTRYSGRCRELSPVESSRRAAAGEAHAIRFAVVPDGAPKDLHVAFHDHLRGTLEFALHEFEDFVLLRRDGRPTYNFAVVVDDAAMGITLVLRGDDHLSNTPRQVLLYSALGHPLPEFAHLPMVRGPDGDRLSKRHGATSVAEYRQRGYPSEGLLNALALLGWSPGADRSIVSLEEMLHEFDLDRVSRSPAIFDPVKLDWVSGQHIHRMAGSALAPEVGRRLVEAGLLPKDAPKRALPWLEEVAEMVRGSIEHFDQIPSRCAGLFAAGVSQGSEAAATLREERAATVLDAFLKALEGDSAPNWDAMKSHLKASTGLKGKALFHPIRLAITGEEPGPELDRLIPLIVSGHALFPDRIPSLRSRLIPAAELAR